MTHFNFKHNRAIPIPGNLIVAFLCTTLIFTITDSTTAAVDDDPRFSDYIDVPEQVGEFILSVTDDQSMPTRATLRYDHESTDERLTLSIRYSDHAINLYQSQLEDFIESDEPLVEKEIDGHDYLVSVTGRQGRRLNIIKYTGEKYISVAKSFNYSVDPEEIPEEISEFMNEFDLSRVINWDIPQEIHEYIDDPEPVVTHFEDFLPAEIEGYSLLNKRPARREPGIRGIYVHEDYQSIATFSLVYDTGAEDLHWAIEGTKYEHGAEPETISAGDFTVNELEAEGEHAFYKFVDDFGISVVGDAGDADLTRQAMIDFIERFDFDELAQWEAPAFFAEEFDQDIYECNNIVCFDSYVAECEQAGMRFRSPALDSRMEFMVEERTEDDGCQVAMQFRTNPNDDWVREPLKFTLTSDHSFVEDYESIFEECLESEESENYDCRGDLMEVIHGE